MKNVINLTKLSPFSRENHTGVFKHFDVHGGEVLTRTGSGDAPLNLAMLGAQKVVCFDDNPMTRFLLEMKMAIAKCYGNPEQYVSMMCELTSRYHQMGARSSGEVLREMSKEACRFWGPMVASGALGDKLFTPMYQKLSEKQLRHILQKNNPYLENQKNFDALKKALDSTVFEYTTASVFKADQNQRLRKKYDGIFLGDLNYSNKEIRLVRFTPIINEMLNKGGSSQVAYEHRSDEKRLNLYHDTQKFQNIEIPHAFSPKLVSRFVKMDQHEI